MQVHDRALQAMRQHLPDQPYLGPHGDPHSQKVLLEYCLQHPTSDLVKDFESKVRLNESKEWLKRVLYIAYMNSRREESWATAL
ncbi:hypothetical protein DM02DRAFT_608047 [Periconia macrospinosa]|uniref:Uncharacterized protein n=1 Tax=Periconia macrospinosa TaxID=97972 RepID=A0A2V1EDP6_9PLEO|nr:hypothetical protein DM02DRAFT_608047 [Periconia macrospinosa]